jgi:Tfp pilus assembly protein PilO
VTARLASLSKGAQIALVAAGLLLVAVIGYFSLISPKRSTAASLKKQTASVQAQIAKNRSTAFTQALPAVRSASVFRLAMAMPSQLQTPDVILQLNALAQDSGISFDQIQPGSASSGTTTTPDPFAAEPIAVTFSGSFYNLLTFLQRMRNLVRVENGELYTAGRLFDVSNIQFARGTKGWPQVQATLTINAFVPQPAAPLTAPGTTGTTSTTTTGTTTTTSNSTSAAPSTSGGTS